MCEEACTELLQCALLQTIHTIFMHLVVLCLLVQCLHKSSLHNHLDNYSKSRSPYPEMYWISKIMVDVILYSSNVTYNAFSTNTRRRHTIISVVTYRANKVRYTSTAKGVWRVGACSTVEARVEAAQV